MLRALISLTLPAELRACSSKCIILYGSSSLAHIIGFELQGISVPILGEITSRPISMSLLWSNKDESDTSAGILTRLIPISNSKEHTKDSCLAENPFIPCNKKFLKYLPQFIQFSIKNRFEIKVIEEPVSNQILEGISQLAWQMTVLSTII